ncbi:hypothetical protein [Konateibacter massiliensis]|uniref:hypothetical protein n=1 Tax=Konateibacter massiliensis TaxID=2002841 RepID=UPI000C155D35|nr:hypothetical protein [Konateibacter massiliensis]
MWKCDTPYPWECHFISGTSIQADLCQNGQIWLEPDKYYSVSFDMNIVALPGNMRKSLTVNLMTVEEKETRKWFAYYFLPTSIQQTFTISTGTIMIHTSNSREKVGLVICLEYPTSVKCGQCSLSILEL